MSSVTIPVLVMVQAHNNTRRNLCNCVDEDFVFLMVLLGVYVFGHKNGEYCAQTIVERKQRFCYIHADIFIFTCSTYHITLFCLIWILRRHIYIFLSLCTLSSSMNTWLASLMM